MAQPEEIPGWSERESEIDDLFKHDPVWRAVQWLDNLDVESPMETRVNKFANALNTAEGFWTGLAPTWHRQARDDALRTCKVWDTDPVTDTVRPIAKIGFLAARGLANQSRLQTTRYGDFADGMEKLREKGRDYSEEFARRAFSRMAMIDGDIAAIYHTLDATINRVFDMPEDPNRQQQAGIGLAYVLAKKTSTPRLMEDFLS